MGVTSFVHHVLQWIKVRIVKPIIFYEIEIHAEVEHPVWFHFE